MTGIADTTMVTMTRDSAQTVNDVVDVVRQAHMTDEALRIVGRGTWLNAGHPVAASRALDVSGLRGITEYVPGDLTLTAGAGTTLAEIADATARHRQWLTLDPFGDPEGTLGATLATASTGPLGARLGLPRDVTLGLSYVTATGDIVHGGGRVVKNVAGFDLVRLSIGAWGTLGVITGATVRLRARPEADETIALELPTQRDAVATLLSTIRIAAIEPIAAEMLTAACARRIGLAGRDTLLVRLAGNAISVTHQRTILSRLSPCEDVSSDSWMRLRQSDPADASIVRVSRRASELSRLWMTTTSSTGIDAHASLYRGVVRLRLTTSLDALNNFDAQDHRVIETMPPSRRREEPPAPNDFLTRRLRDAFDPRRILNRGILGREVA